MVTYDEWVMKSARIGALLVGVVGFFYGTYVMATSSALSWTDVSDTMESVLVVAECAIIIGGFCIAIGWITGLVLGIIASPLRSFTGEHWVREVFGGEMRELLDELSRQEQPHLPNNEGHEEVGSKPGEVVSTPISLKAGKKKIA